MVRVTLQYHCRINNGGIGLSHRNPSTTTHLRTVRWLYRRRLVHFRVVIVVVVSFTTNSRIRVVRIIARPGGASLERLMEEAPYSCDFRYQVSINHGVEMVLDHWMRQASLVETEWLFVLIESLVAAFAYFKRLFVFSPSRSHRPSSFAFSLSLFGFKTMLAAAAVG